jgi:hypothetical protein
MTKTRKPILSDHVREGKVFTPRIVAMGTTHFVTWLDGHLPEYIWLALLHQALADERAVECADALSIAATNQLGAHWAAEAAALSSEEAEAYTAKRWMPTFAQVSHFVRIPADLWSAIKDELYSRGVLADLRTALRPLLALHPGCPLRGIDFDDAATGDEARQIEILRMAVAVMSDRRSPLATIVQGDVIYFAFQREHLKVDAGSSLLDFPEVLVYPTTKKSRDVASAVRAGVNMLVRPHDSDDTDAIAYCQQFWRTNATLVPCAHDTLIDGESDTNGRSG